MGVIILGGPVGAGKTTVARELLVLLPAPLAYIEGDVFWKFISKSDERDRRDNFRMIMRAVTVAAIPFVRFGYTVLLDFSIPPAFLDGARKILKELPLDYVVLRPSVEVCAARASSRAEGKIADYENYREFYALFENAAPYTISDDDGDAATVAKRIFDGLGAGTFRVAESSSIAETNR